jgi:Protein of unknown function (DUF3572)
MRNKQTVTPELASEMGVNFVRFLASDDERLARFQQLTGFDLESIKALMVAGDASFLGQVLDYGLSDESLLLEFAAGEGLDPAAIVVARAKLPGGMTDY